MVVRKESVDKRQPCTPDQVVQNEFSKRIVNSRARTEGKRPVRLSHTEAQNQSVKIMNPFTRHAACIAASFICAASLSAAPALVSPRVPQPPVAAAARAVAENMHGHHPNPGLKTVTSTVDGAPGSLRSVLAGASSGDTIKFLLHYPATISLSNSLVITQSVTIVGPGCGSLTVMRSSVSNTPMFRVFNVQAGTVSISGLTIANGVAFDSTSFFDNVGGGIFNQANLTVTDCIITGNDAPTTGVSPNLSTGFGGGIFSAAASTLTLINTTISGNQASAAGGGLSTIDTTFLAKGCTFSDNFAGGQGGGVNFQGATGTIQNCTISSNSTPEAGYGNGLLSVAFASQGAPSLTLTACTIAGNTGGTNGAFCVIAENEDLGLTNTILSTLVADNFGPNFYFYGTETFVSLGHNLDSDGTSGLVNGVNGDIVGTAGTPINPLLGPLQDNGGPTYTMALLVGSPAIGAGSCADASGSPLHVDQRGFPRPGTSGCDIGAYENEPLTLLCPTSVTVDFQTAAGAVVCYQSKVIDLCPSVEVTYTPPSGSLLPIGETIVNVEAADGCSSNTASCSFTVTVLSPQGVKSNVLDVLDLLASKASPWDKQKIEAAIADVMASLGIGDSNALWLDPTHLDPQNGGTVFQYEQDAVSQLQQIGHSKWNRWPDPSGNDSIKRLVKCDRLLAAVSLQDAITGGGDPSTIAKAKKEIALGDKDAATGKSTDAIQHYWNAWALTVNL